MNVATAPDRSTAAEPHPWAAYVERPDGTLAHVLRGYPTEDDARRAGVRAATLLAKQHREILR